MKRLACIASLSVIVLLVFAAIAVAQSSSDQSGSDQTQGFNSSQQTDPNQGKIAWIHISKEGFDPAQLNVAPGTEVAWVNDDTAPHSVTSEDGKLLDSGPIDPGKTYGVTLDGSGTVNYHGDSQSMAGSIVVGGASGGGSTPASGDTTIPAGDTTTPASHTTTQPAEERQPNEATETTEETQTSGS
jgi:plastocyanin